MLLGEHIGLRPLQSEDIVLLYRWFNDPRILDGLGDKQTLFYVSMEEERKRLDCRISSSTDRSFIIVRLDEDIAIGMVTLLGIDQRNASSEIQILLEGDERWSDGSAAETLRMIDRYTFDVLNLHKIWARIPERNILAINCLKRYGFQTDGFLRDDHYHQGRYMSSLLMSLIKEERKGI